MSQSNLYTRIIGTGSYLPKKIVTNADLEKTLDTTDAWIQDRTGIKQRHIADESETVTHMGTQAAIKALESAGVAPEEIELIMVATCTADKAFPSTAALIQSELGLGKTNIPAFDFQAACSGFVYGLGLADGFIKGGIHRNILLVCSEAMSRVVDWADRGTCVLFGDGAAAVVLQASESPGILSTHLRANGDHDSILFLDNANVQPLGTERGFAYMDGKAVFKLAVKSLEEISLTALEANNMTGADVDWLIPHQANARIIQAMAKKLDLPMSQVILTIAEHANTSAASLPLALDKGIREGRVKPGQNLLFEVFGAGLSWGSAMVRL